MGDPFIGSPPRPVARGGGCEKRNTVICPLVRKKQKLTIQVLYFALGILVQAARIS